MHSSQENYQEDHFEKGYIHVAGGEGKSQHSKNCTQSALNNIFTLDVLFICKAALYSVLSQVLLICQLRVII